MSGEAHALCAGEQVGHPFGMGFPQYQVEDHLWDTLELDQGNVLSELEGRYSSVMGCRCLPTSLAAQRSLPFATLVGSI